MDGSAADRARTACAERVGPPTVLASAPGRVNLVGGHTDYNEGLVLPVAIDRRTAVAGRPRTDVPLTVHSLARGATATVSPIDPVPGTPAWADYVRGVVAELAADGYPISGGDLVVASDVPVGGGLASSAALTVASAFALVGMGGGDPTADLPGIAAVCRRAETDFVGVPCGPMDQVIATRARAGNALLYDCRHGTVSHIPLPADAAILLLDSGVDHALADSPYADRRRACERGVTLLGERLDGVTALRDVPADTFEGHAAALPEPIRSRCRHVVTEIERVRTAAAALEAGDLRGVGTQLTASHASLRDDFAVSCPELDRLVALLDREGVYGARLTGAGFGGWVVAIVDADVAESVGAAVARAYAAAIGTEPAWSVVAADDGARLHVDRT